MICRTHHSLKTCTNPTCKLAQRSFGNAPHNRRQIQLWKAAQQGTPLLTDGDIYGPAGASAALNDRSNGRSVPATRVAQRANVHFVAPSFVPAASAPTAEPAELPAIADDAAPISPAPISPVPAPAPAPAEQPSADPRSQLMLTGDAEVFGQRLTEQLAAALAAHANEVRELQLAARASEARIANLEGRLNATPLEDRESTTQQVAELGEDVAEIKEFIAAIKAVLELPAMFVAVVVQLWAFMQGMLPGRGQ